MPIRTATGSLGAEPGFVLVAEPEHGVTELDPREAFVELSSTEVAVIAQLAMGGSATQAELVSCMREFAPGTGSLEGLESPFLSGVASLARRGRPRDVPDGGTSGWPVRPDGPS